MEAEDDHPAVPDHKLCGFLCAVLTVTSSPSPDDTPPLGTPFHIFRENSSVGFRSHAGDFVLSPVNLPPRCEETPASEKEDASGSEENPKRKPEKKRKKKGSGSGGGGGGSKTTRRKRSVGMVNGSMSVVEQLHALVTYKCLRIETRLVWAEAAAVGGEVRVVLLVDVHLPIELWSGWQFPKCGSVAGALFRHLSCDWKRRSSMMASADCAKDALRACRGVWNLSDCHVLGCKLHYNITDSSKKRLFELHDIFKSLPSVANTGYPDSSRVQPVDNPCRSGIWELTDDMLINILAALGPLELVRIAATCRHLRFLAALIMPCLKLKLFPHQQAAVQWMLRREQHAEVLPHPLYTAFLTEDGFSFYISTITGEIVSDVAPTITDFRGGMFCDEPGLGKTITALSLILKTRGKLADPPDGVKVQWCTHNGDPRCCYYDLGDDSLGGDYCAGTDMTPQKRDLGEKVQTSPEQLGCYSSKRGRLIFLNEQVAGVINLCSDKQVEKQAVTCSETAMPMVPCTRNLSSIKKNLISSLEGAPCSSKEMKAGKNSSTVKHASDGLGHVSWENQEYVSNELSHNSKRRGKVRTRHYEYSDTWVQCDACRKWRKLQESWISDATAAWFCSMNPDPQYQSCNVPEETWNNCGPIMYLPGFYTKGKSDGEEQNKTFFLSVLREHKSAINSATKKALSWLVKLSPEKLSEMETIGVRGPLISTCLGHGEDALAFHRIFQSFGLRKGGEKGNVRWYYPQNLHNLVFDVAALRKALCEPLDSIRLYLSKATLIVVPANLVDHWRTQIQKHVSSGQLRLHIWTDHKKSSVHSLAWDYDVVITTFSRLSAEWSSRKKSILMQIHWLRVILDEGHTLGSSVGLTNKLQMAVSLIASNRWILTGTPTPNTPNSQLSHLQPLLKFLHEEAYGQNQKSWEAGILRPFEAEMEEGRSRLLHLLNRCMISARKADLRNIPPCIKKVTLLDFTGEHARSYNELVVTVRRNILMADWNDDSHVESLLNRKQWKFRSTTIRNIRLSCCVAGHIKVTDAGQDIQETMDVLVEDGLDPMSEQYAFIKYNLLNGGNCVRCGEWCRLPVITPCRHLLCLDCVALDSERCTYPGCGNLYEMETPDALARPENPEPKWPVPKNLIELQPSYKQDNWDPDWQSTSSSKVAYLIRSLKELQNADSEAHLPKEDGTDVENIQGILYTSWTRNYNINTHKVLVFSQFLEHIHVIEQQLTIADIKFAGMYSPMHSSNKMKSLTMFQNDASCMVLLMDGSAALGLDLSFVSHVFLMEPIWNRSLEEQVISRAHRMGATRPIYVETLAMRSTIEEQMLAFLQDPDECRRILKQELGNTDSEVARTHRSLHDFAEKNYLSQLRFMRTNPIT